MSIPKVANGIVRLFGVVNLSFAAFGFYLILAMAFRLWPAEFRSESSPRYFLACYAVMTGVNLLFLLGLSVGGMRLLRLQESGMKICNALFTTEIAYVLGSAFLFSILLPGLGFHSLPDSVAAAGGVGDMGIAPQVITGYPVAALVGLNLARRRAFKR